MKTKNRLGIRELMKMWGAARSDISSVLRKKIEAAKLTYRSLDQIERDQIVLKVTSNLDADRFSRVGEHRAGIWQNAWRERAQAFAKNCHKVESLLPAYYDANSVIRLNQDYVLPTTQKFESRFQSLYREWLFMRTLSFCSTIYEFGCGSGYNLVEAARLFPEKKLIGLDWAPSAVKLVTTLGKKRGLNLHGRRFDFFHPDKKFSLAPNSGVVTMCALEQVGDRFEPFLNYLLSQKPQVCVHVEPLVELYDLKKLPDYLAARYHCQRGYLNGLVDRFRLLERKKKIKILRLQRIPLGSLYHEGYSTLVWKPVTRTS